MRAQRRSSLKRIAYLEYQVTRQLHRGQLFDMEEQPGGWRTIEQCHVPGWFVRSELGFGYGESPSIIWTLSTLGIENRRRFEQARIKNTPPKLAAKNGRRMTSKQRKKFLNGLANRAGLRVSGGGIKMTA